LAAVVAGLAPKLANIGSTRLAMMHFTSPAADNEMLAELRDALVLSPDVIERIDSAMGRPESGTLNDFLLAGAEIVPERPWLFHLIRRHGCHRFGRVGWHGEAAPCSGGGWPDDGNAPYRRCADGSFLLAILRPDHLPATLGRMKPARLHRAAATLCEIRDLRTAWMIHSHAANPVH
jgi:hypothetical protein